MSYRGKFNRMKKRCEEENQEEIGGLRKKLLPNKMINTGKLLHKMRNI
jgi:hypothetical protein